MFKWNGIGTQTFPLTKVHLFDLIIKVTCLLVYLYTLQASTLRAARLPGQPQHAIGQLPTLVMAALRAATGLYLNAWSNVDKILS